MSQILYLTLYNYQNFNKMFKNFDVSMFFNTRFYYKNVLKKCTSTLENKLISGNSTPKRWFGLNISKQEVSAILSILLLRTPISSDILFTPITTRPSNFRIRASFLSVLCLPDFPHPLLVMYSVVVTVVHLPNQ
jgi:hypothetical protein